MYEEQIGPKRIDLWLNICITIGMYIVEFLSRRWYNRDSRIFWQYGRTSPIYYHTSSNVTWIYWQYFIYSNEINVRLIELSLVNSLVRT